VPLPASPPQRRRLSILGSTGSIGTQALDVVRHHAGRFEVVALAARSNVALLLEQVAEFRPAFVHVGNETAAREALAAYPGGLQIGGGIHRDNAEDWLAAGASHVIVTSWVFRDGRLDQDRLQALVRAVGASRLVLDLSCRRRGNQWFVVTDRWQKFTELALGAGTLHKLSESCAEFLIHAVDVEGLGQGIDEELVRQLGDWTPIPTTYAGGATSLADLETVTRVGRGRIDLTIGSALDIFGGTGVRYADAVAFNRSRERSPGG